MLCPLERPVVPIPIDFLKEQFHKPIPPPQGVILRLPPQSPFARGIKFLSQGGEFFCHFDVTDGAIKLNLTVRATLDGSHNFLLHLSQIGVSAKILWLSNALEIICLAYLPINRKRNGGTSIDSRSNECNCASNFIANPCISLNVFIFSIFLHQVIWLWKAHKCI